MSGCALGRRTWHGWSVATLLLAIPATVETLLVIFFAVLAVPHNGAGLNGLTPPKLATAEAGAMAARWGKGGGRKQPA